MNVEPSFSVLSHTGHLRRFEAMPSPWPSQIPLGEEFDPNQEHIPTSWGARSSRQLPQISTKVSSFEVAPTSSVPIAPANGYSLFDCLLQELAKEHLRELRAQISTSPEQPHAYPSVPCEDGHPSQVSIDHSPSVQARAHATGVTLNLQPSVITEEVPEPQPRPVRTVSDYNQPSMNLSSHAVVPLRIGTGGTNGITGTNPMSNASNKTSKSFAFVERFTDAVKHSVFAHYQQKIGTKQASLPQGKIAEFFMAKGWFRSSDHLKDQPRIVKLVHSSQFDNVCAVAILLNAILLGVAIDHSAKLDDPDNLPSFYETAALLFTAWFLLELALRLFADGVCTCFKSNKWGWNMFDALIVSIDLVTVCWQTETSNNALQNVSVIRIFRVFRIARALRIVRLFRFFKDLRMMVMSILKSGSSLVWCCVMLCLIIYVFAIYLMQIVTYHVSENRDRGNIRYQAELDKNFGTLTKSVYSLFQAVSGGISWHLICDPLISVHWSNALVFCFYIFFTLFAMLNIVTGIFVQSAMTSAQNDQEEVLKEQLHYENSAVQRLKHLFQAVDVNRTGNITWPDFEASLHSPDIRAQLATLGIDVHEAHGIFKLLDLDASGTLSIEEFVFGCMRMKGTAKNVDLTSLIYEHKRMANRFSSFFTLGKKEFARHASFEKNLEQILTREFGSAGHSVSHFSTPRTHHKTDYN